MYQGHADFRFFWIFFFAFLAIENGNRRSKRYKQAAVSWRRMDRCDQTDCSARSELSIEPNLVVTALAPMLRGQPGRNLGDNDGTTRHLSGRSVRVLASGLAFMP
jgi:hypothetical protein